jgi:hypothetical protein
VATSTSSGSGTDNALSVAALVLAGFAVLVALLAVWLGRPRFGAQSASGGGDQPDEAPPPSGVAR